MKTYPLVSVIVTTYDRVTYLEQTLESIQNQTYTNIEILVIDDGSEEKMALKCKTICDKYSKCTYYYKINSGQPDSRNYGIKRSKGEYIAFCDDDDYWVLNKLEYQINFLNKNNDYDVVAGCVEYIDNIGNELGLKKCNKDCNKNFFNTILKKNQINSPTPLIRKKVFENIGFFNPNFTIAEDWEFYRRVAYSYKIKNVEKTLAFLRFHDGNMTKSRTTDPLEAFLLYRKLTISLLHWGKSRFKKEDSLNIYKTEWLTYRKILTNRCPGVLKKVKFIWRIANNNPMNLFHFCYLLMRFNRII